MGSKAHHYGDGTTLHWRRHEALVDHDGEWLDMDIPAEVSRPIIHRLDQSWGSDFNAITRGAEELKRQFVDQAGVFVAQLAEWPALKEHCLVIGKATTVELDVALREERQAFDTFVHQKRGGYAEAVHERVQTQVASRLHEAKHFSGTGSFSTRQGTVTRRISTMSFADSCFSEAKDARRASRAVTVWQADGRTELRCIARLLRRPLGWPT